MAIAYIYYKNSMKNVTVYLWEPNEKSRRYNLRPIGDNVFACKEIAINFQRGICFLKHNNQLFEAPLRDPTKDYRYIKHEARFDVRPVGDWEVAF